jgi:hypothetical protein
MIEFSNIIFESLITCVLLTNIFNIWFNKLYIKDSSYIKLIPMSICAILAINGLTIGTLYENKTELFSTIIYLLTLIGFLGLIYFLYENGKSEAKK